MRQTATHVFTPPTSGWIASSNILTPPPNGATLLDNWYPTASTARLRRGSLLRATTGAAVVRLLPYNAGAASRLFAATADSVFDVTAPADPEVAPAPALAGQASGDWSSVQISTGGGNFMVAVNGRDAPWFFNGATVTPYGGGTNLTGPAPEDLSQVNMHQQRLFFVEQGTTKFWYLGPDAIAGALDSFELGSVFREGGALLFTAVWSLDSGDGLGDKFVAVSTEGEVAIYSGTNPNDAATWVLDGVYKIGRPLGKHAFQSTGGELLIFTEEGIIPISSAIRLDEGALAQAAVSYAIEDAWTDLITRRTRPRPVTHAYWSQEGMLLIGLGEQTAGGGMSFVLNTRTKAWARYIGWDVACAADLGGRLYFGSDNGQVFEGEVSGSDAGAGYTAAFAPQFSLCGTDQIKYPNHVNGRFRSSVDVNFSATCFTNFAQNDVPIAPVLAEPADQAVWGAAVAGVAVLGGGTTYGRDSSVRGRDRWKTVRGNGFSIAPCILVQSNSVASPNVELTALSCRYETGARL